MNTKPLLAWSSEHHSSPLPAAHPFPLARYALVREALLAEGVLESGWLTRSDMAPEAWLRGACRARPTTGGGARDYTALEQLPMVGPTRGPTSRGDSAAPTLNNVHGSYAARAPWPGCQA